MQTLRNASILTGAILLLFGFQMAFAAPDNGQGKGHEKAVCPKNNEEVHCHAHVSTDEKGNPHVTNRAISGYGPLQFQTAYGVAGLSPASTQTVAIVDAYDDPRAESDLAVYSQTFGLPSCTTANGC